MRKGSRAVAFWPAGTLMRAKLLSSLTGRSPVTPAGLGGGFTNSIAISSPLWVDVFSMSTEMSTMPFFVAVVHGTFRFEYSSSSSRDRTGRAS